MGGWQELTHETQRPFSSQPSSTIFPVAQSCVAQTGSLRPLRAADTDLSQPVLAVDSASASKANRMTFLKGTPRPSVRSSRSRRVRRG